MRLAKTSFELTVLHMADAPVKNCSLDDLQYEITEGDCLGMLKLVGTETVPPEKARDAMLELGNDGSFFEDRGDDDEDSDDDTVAPVDAGGQSRANPGGYPSTGYAKVEWSVGDITCLVNVSDEKAAAWLDRNHKHIQERMAEAGWEAIHTLIAMDNPAREPVAAGWP